MNRLSRIATTAWALLLIELVLHAVWSHMNVHRSEAIYPPPNQVVHWLLLKREIPLTLLAITALVASIRMKGARGHGPAWCVMILSAIALLIWGQDLIRILRQPYVYAGTRELDWLFNFWNKFAIPPIRCLLAASGLVCGWKAADMKPDASDPSP